MAIDSEGLYNKYFILWILSAAANTAFSFYWDIKMDWGLLAPVTTHPHLRKNIVFPANVCVFVRMCRLFRSSCVS
jgi:hypothetical protein